MAIQAGRVGVDPSQVTLSGKIKGGGVSPEVLTKEEAVRIYQTILGMAEYLKKTDANSLYQKISDMVDYQLKLVSGQNIKRINGEDLLGSGNISVLTTQLADGIYQKISDMADYVLKSELPDMTDLLTKTEAPGYNDILTKTTGLPLISNKLNIDGSSISYKTGAYDFNYFISGLAYATSTCLSMPTSDTEYLIISSGDIRSRIQIAMSVTSSPTIYVRKLYTVSSLDTWTEWFSLPSIADLNRKQDLLTAGTGINISNNVITNEFESLLSPNLNDIKYNFSGYVRTATNTPSGTNTNGYLQVIARKGNTSYTKQIFTPYNSNDTYIRLNNEGWGAWVKIFDTSDVIGAVNGGTGETTLKNGCTALIGSLLNAVGTVIDSTPIITGGNTDATANTAYYRRNASGIWNYILNKLDGATGTVTASTTNFTSSTFVLTKSGKVCTLFFTGTIKVTTNGWITIGTIPTGYRPSAMVNFDAYTRVSTNNYEVMSLLDAIINTNGTIQIYAWSGNNGQIVRKQFTYICS